MTNKLRINESEIERLNEMMKKRQSDSAEEINRWRQKVSQTQEEVNKALQ